MFSAHTVSAFLLQHFFLLRLVPPGHADFIFISPAAIRRRASARFRAMRRAAHSFDFHFLRHHYRGHFIFFRLRHFISMTPSSHAFVSLDFPSTQSSLQSFLLRRQVKSAEPPAQPKTPVSAEISSFIIFSRRRRRGFRFDAPFRYAMPPPAPLSRQLQIFAFGHFFFA